MERRPPSHDKERPPLRQSMAAIRARQGPADPRPAPRAAGPRQVLISASRSAVRAAASVLVISSRRVVPGDGALAGQAARAGAPVPAATGGWRAGERDLCPARLPACICQSGPGSARTIFLVSPSGHEHYQKELAELVASTAGPLDAAIAELRARYDIEQLTPPGNAWSPVSAPARLWLTPRLPLAPQSPAGPAGQAIDAVIKRVGAFAGASARTARWSYLSADIMRSWPRMADCYGVWALSRVGGGPFPGRRYVVKGHRRGWPGSATRM